MSEAKISLLSKLLHEMELEIGTSDLATAVLRTLKSAVSELRFERCAQLHAEFMKLCRLMAETKPRYGILNYYFNRLLHEIEGLDAESQYCREKLIQKIDELYLEAKTQRERLVQFADEINANGKTILIHDHSHTVHAVLKHFKAKKQKFRVIIAEQDYNKTHENIEVLHEAEIPFQVVPDYMLCHIYDEVDMVFFGAITLKNTMHFVMDPGACGVISQFKAMNIPVYCFINTTKFSLWKSEIKKEIYFRQHRRRHHAKPIEYDRVKYSHDRVPVDFFHRIVTNEGMFTPKKLEQLFTEKLEQYQKQNKSR